MSFIAKSSGSFNISGLTAALILLVAVTFSSASAQEDSLWSIKQLSDHIYEIYNTGSGYTVKVVASVGADGILIVDAGQTDTGESLKKVLQTLGDSTPEIIITTHSHIEHTGGNKAFGRDPVIIGHELARQRLRSDSYLFDEFPDEALPEVTFTDSLTIHFNGEIIKLRYFGGAHDNSDIVIWFTQSNVACVGALSNGFHFPSVDGTTGNIFKYPEKVREVMAYLPEDVMIIPGHGDDCTMADYRAFLDMLVETEKVVIAGLESGKDVETLQEEDVLARWASFDGPYSDRNYWIGALAAGWEKKNSPPETRQKLYEPMYYAIRDHGVDSAIALYHRLKKEQPDDYIFAGDDIFIIAYKLRANDRLDDAARFCQLYLSEVPDGQYGYFGHYILGLSYEEKADTTRAIQHYKESLKLNADSPKVVERLKALEGD